jgi:CBS domain-containing protein
MWKGDFGMLPVTDVDGHVTGVLTDRDIAIALGTRNDRASSVRVGDVMSRAVRTCRRDDDMAGALETMRKAACAGCRWWMRRTVCADSCR